MLKKYINQNNPVWKQKLSKAARKESHGSDEFVFQPKFSFL